MNSTTNRSLCAMAVLLAGSLVLLLIGCRAATTPRNEPEASCAAYCVKRAKGVCSEDACERGCALIIDRLVEREATTVVDCVASRSAKLDPEFEARASFETARMTTGMKTGDRCGDAVWANCAARVGPYRDGGPPAPPPPEEFND
jgi:hypothetical protein